MAVIDQTVSENYALYNGDCLEVLSGMDKSFIDLSIYSPPFCGLYNYSSDHRDMSNNKSYDDFFVHYGYLIDLLHEKTKRGRFTAVHCMDIPKNGSNFGGLIDFSGDIIRAHEKAGWEYWARYHVWKEPMGVRLRTMAKGLAHKTIVEDASLCDVAGADYLLLFRKRGECETPISHPTGLHRYAGSRQMPAELLKFKGWTGKQTQNRYSHWIWRQYASAFWDDIRIDRVLPYKESKDPEDEKHVHPLQLDVIERTVVLRSNPGDIVFTPFMGVGSEVYGAVINGRKGIGAELKTSYYKQAVRNLAEAEMEVEQPELFT